MASIQKRTSPVKFAHLAEKSGKGLISNLSTKVAGVSKGQYMNYWEGWLHSTYGDPSPNDMNTLWVVFFVASDDFAVEALTRIVKTTFSTMTDLKNIFLLIPGNQDSIDVEAVDKVRVLGSNRLQRCRTC